MKKKVLLSVVGFLLVIILTYVYVVLIPSESQNDSLEKILQEQKWIENQTSEWKKIAPEKIGNFNRKGFTTFPVIAEYAGSDTFTGRYTYFFNESNVPEAVYFLSDDKSSPLGKVSVFLYNSEKFLQAAGLNKNQYLKSVCGAIGTTTISIKDFQFIITETDATHRATFERDIKTFQPDIFLPCSNS